ncbi:MAG: thermonuclease family protein [Chitinophagaceae bacterium]
MKLILFICLLLINSRQASRQSALNTVEQTSKVIKIVDGDTFDVLTKEKTTLRIRMNGIDCPERKQDFYQSAKNALAGYIFNKEVTLFITGRDRNKRTIATVYCNGENINLSMIKNGYAWHYKKYSSDTIYAKAEKVARLARKGLWRMDHPVAPWDFRKK